MPIIDIGHRNYKKASPNFDLVSNVETPIQESDRLKIGEPYILTDSSIAKDDDGGQLDQFAGLFLDKSALIDLCGPEIIEKWDAVANLTDSPIEELPGITIDHQYVKHLGIIMQEDSDDPSIAIEESDNTPENVLRQQSVLAGYGDLMSTILLAVAKKAFRTEGYEDLSTQIDMMAHILKRRHFPCFGTEANGWWNNLSLHTSPEIQDLTRDRANFNGAVPMPALFMQGSGRVYLSRFAQVFEAERYSVLLLGGGEQVVVSKSSQDRRLIALGRCEENVVRHYEQYDPLSQMRDRMAKELGPQ